jgi:hypothetical protein
MVGREIHEEEQLVVQESTGLCRLSDDEVERTTVYPVLYSGEMIGSEGVGQARSRFWKGRERTAHGRAPPCTCGANSTGHVSRWR